MTGPFGTAIQADFLVIAGGGGGGNGYGAPGSGGGAGGYRTSAGTSGGGASAEKSGFPSLTQMGETFYKQLSRPFYDNGPNDKGIGIQLAYSLGRVALGFLLAMFVAIPFGFLIGMSPLA